MRSHPVVMGAALAISLLGCTEPQPSTPQTDGAPDVPTDVVTARDVIDAGDTPDATDGGNPGDGAARGDAATDRAVVEETIPVLDGGCLGGPSTLHVATSGQVSHTTNPDIDLLFAIDNSDSAAENRSNLARNLDVLLRELVDPPTIAGTLRYQYPPARSLHVGVISTDLGTPGSTVPSCANGAEGDSGLLNPTRNGLALRAHPPWTSAPAGDRPTRCTTDRNQYPAFLQFDAARIDPADPVRTYQVGFAEDFVCTAYLSTGGCEAEQQLESVYRALVVHDPRATPGNIDPNAGFVRDDALLAIVVITDEEDGSVRDCRYAERGAACTDALRVYDLTSPLWGSSDLNLRFYMYRPGTPQDPTWPIDRYMDPRAPLRGFTSLKPGHPERVFFSAIAGVPINLPRSADGSTIDWDALLGSAPDGSGGYVGSSDEGPISMRQANMDPSCPTRVVPACRREGTAYDPTSPSCDPATQFFALPSRRIAQVARRFAESYQTGTLTSVCRRDYSTALQPLVDRMVGLPSAQCIPRAMAAIPSPCEPGDSRTDCVRVQCDVREVLPAGVRAASACTARHGRAPGSRDAATGRDTCVVRQLAHPLGAGPPDTGEGWYYDTRIDPALTCRQRIEFTPDARVESGASARIECLSQETADPPSGDSCTGTVEVGGACTPPRRDGASCVPTSPDPAARLGCFASNEVYLESGSRECASGLCTAYRYDETGPRGVSERSAHVHCTCRCGVPPELAGSVDPRSLCACPPNFECRADVAGGAFPESLRGSYCVRVGATP